MRHLDTINPIECHIGWGEIGKCGCAGYNNSYVIVDGIYYEHCISAHAPSEIVYFLDEQYESLICSVGINDTALDHNPVTFQIWADDLLVSSCEVNKGKSNIEVNIHKAKFLKLICLSETLEYSHSVWIDPVLSESKINQFTSSMGGILINTPNFMLKSKRCIALSMTSNFVDIVDNCLGSLRGQLNDIDIVIFSYDTNEKCRRMAWNHKAHIIECSTDDKSRFNLKTVLYNAASVIGAEQFLIIDSDLIFQCQIEEIFNTLDVLGKDSVLVAKEYNQNYTLRQAAHAIYDATERDLEYLGISHEELKSSFVINGGVIALSRDNLLKTNQVIKDMLPQSSIWEKAHTRIRWREQFILNVALIRLGKTIELNKIYNMQLLHESIDHINQAKIIHVNGSEVKEQYPFLFDLHRNLPPIDRNSESVDDSVILHSYYENKALMNIDLAPFKIITNMLDQPVKRSLDVDVLGGVASGYLSSISENVLSIGFNHTGNLQQLWSRLPNYGVNITHDQCDPLVGLKKLNDNKDKFDLIYIPTYNNDKQIFIAILQSFNILNENGVLILHDISYPLCNMYQLKLRLKHAGCDIIPLSDILMKIVLQEIASE